MALKYTYSRLLYDDNNSLEHVYELRVVPTIGESVNDAIKRTLLALSTQDVLDPYIDGIVDATK